MSNQAEPPWVALWRHKDPLTLWQAAAWLCELEPDRTYRPYERRSEAEQQECDRRQSMFNRLREAVKAGILQADLKQWHRDARRHENQFTREVTFTKAESGTNYEGSKVARADLAAWARNDGLNPDPFPITSGNIAETSMADDRAIAALALLLARSLHKFRNGERPNASQIGCAVAEVAAELYGEDTKGFEQFRKRLARALKQYPEG